MDDTPLMYEEGRVAHGLGRTREACPYPAHHGAKKSWWLAGWIDADIEHKATLRATNGAGVAA